MKQPFLTSTIALSVFISFTYGQANQDLSNLTAPTAVNADLVPGAANTKNLGTSALGWKDLQLQGNIYLDGARFVSNFPGVRAFNVFVGSNTGNSVTTGTYNTGIGHNAILKTTTGYGNTALGANALYSNTSGNYNAAQGRGALYHNTEGSGNIAIGNLALTSNTTGASNVAIGTMALSNNTTLSHNVAIGDSALLNQSGGPGQNTAVGSRALYFNLTGYNNTAIGYISLYSNTTGTHNTAIGAYGLSSNTSGIFNTAIGHAGLYSNTIGNFNTGSGVDVLYSNKTGSHNTANGYLSLWLNTTGSYNTANGSYSLDSNATGSYNTANGYKSLNLLTTGGGNTGDGAFTDVKDTGQMNSTAIGYNTVVDASNKVRVGNALVTSIGGQVGWSTFSDARYKQNIQQDVHGLDFINSLTPVTFTVNTNGLKDYYNKGRKSLPAGPLAEKMKTNSDNNEGASKIIYNGFVAQDVEAAAKKLNYDFSGVDKPQTPDGLYGLRYSDFVVPLVKAVQQLSIRNDSLKEENITLQQQSAIIIARLEKLEAFLKVPAVLSIKLTDVFLDQNVPNPFGKATTIGYSLPQSFSRAEMQITDAAGNLVKKVNLSGSGKGVLPLDAGILAGGAYNYSLYVDNKLVETKKMLLTK